MSGKIGRAGRPQQTKKVPTPNSPVDTFFRRLNMVMVTQKVTHRKMQEDTGICRDSLYYHRRQNTLPSGDQILKLCRYFRVSADWMLGLSSDICGLCKFPRLRG